jgi:hypothetical protein
MSVSVSYLAHEAGTSSHENGFVRIKVRNRNIICSITVSSTPRHLGYPLADETGSNVVKFCVTIKQPVLLSSWLSAFICNK